MVGLNMTLEAKDIGVDSCMITPEQKRVKNILKIKKSDTVPLIIAFGYQKKGAFQKKREREILSKMTSFEFFGGKK